MTKRKAAPGDVCEFDLGDGRYAYGRVLRDASVAVYRSTSSFQRQPPIGERDFAFIVGVYDDVPGSAACPVVGRDPFDDPTDAWPPPHKVVDPITQRVRIYHHGEIHEASDPAAAEKLEKATVWDLQHLIDRIRGSLSG